jgi:hypothetical protein
MASPLAYVSFERESFNITYNNVLYTVRNLTTDESREIVSLGDVCQYVLANYTPQIETLLHVRITLGNETVLQVSHNVSKADAPIHSLLYLLTRMRPDTLPEGETSTTFSSRYFEEVPHLEEVSLNDDPVTEEGTTHTEEGGEHHTEEVPMAEPVCVTTFSLNVYSLPNNRYATSVDGNCISIDTVEGLSALVYLLLLRDHNADKESNFYHNNDLVVSASHDFVRFTNNVNSYLVRNL